MATAAMKRLKGRGGKRRGEGGCWGWGGGEGAVEMARDEMYWK